MVVGQLKGDLGKQTSIKSLRNSFACSDQKAGIPLAVCVRITARINQLLCLTANQHINSSVPYEHFGCVPLSWGGEGTAKMNSL